MTTELHVTLRGREQEMNARRVLLNLQQLLRVLGELEDVQLHGSVSAAERSAWTFSSLGTGSIEAAIMPLEPRRGATWRDMDSVALTAVRGFRQAEGLDALPDGWSAEAAQPAATLAGALGLLPEFGMHLRLVVDDRTTEEATVTRRTESNLRTALRVRRESIGSVLGQLDSVSLHGRKTAGLWLDRGKGRVRVTFTAEQTPEVRDALGSRVSVIGRLRRNDQGQLLSVSMRRLERLPSNAEAPTIDRLVGAAPGLTGALSTEEHLKEIRGAS